MALLGAHRIFHFSGLRVKSVVEKKVDYQHTLRRAKGSTNRGKRFIVTTTSYDNLRSIILRKQKSNWAVINSSLSAQHPVRYLQRRSNRTNKDRGEQLTQNTSSAIVKCLQLKQLSPNDGKQNSLASCRTADVTIIPQALKSQYDLQFISFSHLVRYKSSDAGQLNESIIKPTKRGKKAFFHKTLHKDHQSIIHIYIYIYTGEFSRYSD